MSVAEQKLAGQLTPGFVTDVVPGRPNVLGILDEFSTPAFASVCNLYQADPANPVGDLDVIDVDFVLVESVWRGNGWRWPHLAQQVEDGWPLQVLLTECRRRSIPTVFWNKEDPPHFETFLEVASQFDFVFTSDAQMIGQYRERLGHDRVDLLRFAAAPSIHNPRRVDQFRDGDIAFAGQYFAHKYPERREQMEILFPAAAKHRFSIFSRLAGGDERYAFPARWKSFVVGSLPYSEMVREYRRHKVFLNVNSVVSSKTMCARRVFELSAAKTAVVGTQSAAVRSVYDSESVPLVSSTEEASELFSTLLENDSVRRKIVQRAWRTTLSEHTYSDRLRQISSAIGLSLPASAPAIQVLIRSHSKEGTERVISDILAQEFSFPTSSLQLLGDVSAPLASNVWRTVESGAPLKTNGILALVDDRFQLAPNYLSDLVLTLHQQGENAAAKVVANTLAVGPTEETLVPNFPEHGGVIRTDAPCFHDAATLGDALDRLDANLRMQPTYMSDPLDITPRGAMNV